MVRTASSLITLLMALLSPTLCSTKGNNSSIEPDDLRDNYLHIFKSGNRNAASHLWTDFVLQRANSLPEKAVLRAFKFFCAVSGSLLPDDPRTIYKVVLPRVTGGNVSGTVHHCCWPCICDMHDLVRVDTKKIETADGKKVYDFLVIGDPCKNATRLDAKFKDPFSGEMSPLSMAAPELKCHDGKLVGAHYSDHGYPIIGMLFNTKDQIDAADKRYDDRYANDPTFGFGGMCVMRQRHGFNSGMGLIFHLVADITSIPNTAPLPYPDIPAQKEDELIQKAALVPAMVSSDGELMAVLPHPVAAWLPSAGLGMAGFAAVACFMIRWHRSRHGRAVADTEGHDSESLGSEDTVE
mmetsp:Transcript_23986/g.46063  ORF Transcript_23986/g.46063 Transcript_23986/m.46063 type:complete len:352 (-) Transcript_23986:140-1195(-)